MTILITGATGGIGREIVQQLIGHNTIIACGRNDQHLKELKDSITSNNLILKKIDVTNENDIKKLISELEQLDVLINCAAILSPVGRFLENDLSVWKNNIQTNLLGTVNMCYFTLPLLLKSPRGKVINFSGGGGAFARSHHTAYATAKTAVIRFTETLAIEYPQLDVNVIAPGAYKTPMWAQETHDQQPEKWGEMDKLLNFIDFLTSEKSNGITGKFLNYKDDWQHITKETKSDLYTLRRIDNFLFTPLKK